MDDEILLRVHSNDIHDQLIVEVGDCLETGLYTDLIIRCRDGHSLHAHKLILSSASPYLKWVLENNDWEDVQTIDIPDVSQDEVSLLLEVVYHGVVEATLEDLRKLILLAHQLYISIPISDELMNGLHLVLPPIHKFVPRNMPKLKQRPTFPSPTKVIPESLLAGPPLLQPPSTGSLFNNSLLDSNSGSGVLGPILQPSNHVCPICNSSYSNIGNFKQHMRLHDNDHLKDQRNQMLENMVSTGYNPETSLYTCHVCGSTYNHSGNFKQHLLKHERESGSISAMLVAQGQVGTNSHLASVLQSAMTDRVNHGDEDSDKMQYVCEFCMRGFKHPGNFKQHLLSHLKSAPANSVMGTMVTETLNKINATFGHSGSHAKKKMKLDSDSGSGNGSVCPECKEEFASESELEAHFISKHGKVETSSTPDGASVKMETGDDKPFPCDKCHQGFTTEDEYEDHLPNCNPANLDLSTEDSGYGDWPTVVKRKPGRPPKLHAGGPGDNGLVAVPIFPCKICGKGFQKLNKLTAHMKVHSAPEDHYKHPCDICGKKFTRPQHVNRHKLLHTGEKPFKCWQCGKDFAREDKCKYHMRNECEFRQQTLIASSDDQIENLLPHLITSD